MVNGIDGAMALGPSHRYYVYDAQSLKDCDELKRPKHQIYLFDNVWWESHFAAILGDSLALSDTIPVNAGSMLVFYYNKASCPSGVISRLLYWSLIR